MDIKLHPSMFFCCVFLDPVTSAVIRARNLNRCGFSSSHPDCFPSECARFSHTRLFWRAHRSPKLLFLYLKICFHSHCEPQEGTFNSFTVRHNPHLAPCTARKTQRTHTQNNTHRNISHKRAVQCKGPQRTSPANRNKQCPLGLNSLAKTLLDINHFKPFPDCPNTPQPAFIIPSNTLD